MSAPASAKKANTGLTALDEERAASLADEGGASAAALDDEAPEVSDEFCAADTLPLGVSTERRKERRER